MRSKRIIMALIVAIMMISAVACGSANKAEESKTTDETTKEVTSTVAPTETTTEATTTATEATTQAVTEATTMLQKSRELLNTVVFKFDNDFKLSENTCNNIINYFEDRTFKKGNIIDLSQIQYLPDEYDSMQYFGFLMIDIFPHNWNSSDYNAPFEFTGTSNSKVEVTYNSLGLTIKRYSLYD